MDGSVHGQLEDYGLTASEEANRQSNAEDRCLRDIGDVELEEVERCAFFETYGDVPPAGSDVVLVRESNSRRPAAALKSSLEVVGLLPTKWNYLASCLAQGYAYEGLVAVAEVGNPSLVVVTLAPIND